MRKLLTTILLAALTFSGVYAQKLDDVQEKFSKGKFDEAKEKIDKILEDSKNQKEAKAWFWKGKVYTELAKQDTAGTLSYNAANEAFEAFKKYQELDPKNVMMALEQNVGLFQLYDLHYNSGIRFYNQKDYSAAFEKMKAAMALEQYIAGKNFSYNDFAFPALDTQLINLTAFSAYLAKQEDEAIPYFEMLADAKISDKDYKEIYGLLAEYHMKKKNAEKADKYLAMGRQLFPDNDYWISLEFGDPGSDTLARFARYEELMTKYPDNYALGIDYAVELFNYTYSYDKKPADYKARQERLGKVLTTVTTNNSNSALAHYVMAQHVYNQIYDIEDAQRAIKGTAAADVAKRKELTSQLNQKYEELLPHALKSYELYSAMSDAKMQDKVNMKKSIDQLVDYYQRKKDQAKVDFYQAKQKTAFQ